MGSNAEEPVLEDEINVLVTGFAPFRAQYPVNPSWEIANSLPPFLPPPSNPYRAIELQNPPVVRLLVHPEPVWVAYKTVRELVPKIWAGRKIDYAVHIGMATNRHFYSVERRAHRDGYLMKDVDNLLLGDDERRKSEGKGWIWEGLPETLLSSIDVDDVWRRWRLAVPDIDVRVSEDAGRYLCDFIYYSSLANLEKNNEDKRVVFLHVPVNASPEAIKIGTEACIELIRAVVQSGKMKKFAGSSRELTKQPGGLSNTDLTA